MKVKVAIKRMCKDCKIVRRRGRLRVVCKSNPRHKQRQPFSTAAGAASSPLGGGEALGVGASFAPDSPLSLKCGGVLGGFLQRGLFSRAAPSAVPLLGAGAGSRPMATLRGAGFSSGLRGLLPEATIKRLHV